MLLALSMDAIVRDKTTGAETKIQTEPLTNYNILVLDQALKDRSYLTFTNTNVIREGTEQRDANVSGLDLNLYDNSDTYNVKVSGRFSNIFGPDSYNGFNTILRAGKVSGKFQYFLQNSIDPISMIRMTWDILPMLTKFYIPVRQVILISNRGKIF